VKPAFRLRVRFFLIFEKEALEDFDLMMIPSTANTAWVKAITAKIAIDFLITCEYDFEMGFIICTKLT
jgi:hypothetical protein